MVDAAPATNVDAASKRKSATSGNAATGLAGLPGFVQPVFVVYANNSATNEREIIFFINLFFAKIVKKENVKYTLFYKRVNSFCKRALY